jgi:hypothetical protein
LFNACSFTAKCPISIQAVLNPVSKVGVLFVKCGHCNPPTPLYCCALHCGAPSLIATIKPDAFLFADRQIYLNGSQDSVSLIDSVTRLAGDFADNPFLFQLLNIPLGRG